MSPALSPMVWNEFCQEIEEPEIFFSYTQTEPALLYASADDAAIVLPLSLMETLYP